MTDIVERLRAWITGESAAIAPRTNLAIEYMRAAAEEIESLRRENARMRAPLDWIEKHYPNQDMNHEDFRVEAYNLALDALPSPPSQESGT